MAVPLSPEALRSVDKPALIADFIARLASDLAGVEASQRLAQDGATNSENRAEGDKDMRATESSYIARGQASRVLDLRDEFHRSSSVKARAFTADTPIAVGSLVLLQDEAGAQHLHLLMPGGAGTELSTHIGGRTVPLTVISSRSPLGHALLGAFEGEGVAVELAGKPREWSIDGVA